MVPHHTMSIVVGLSEALHQLRFTALGWLTLSHRPFPLAPGDAPYSGSPLRAAPFLDPAFSPFIALRPQGLLAVLSSGCDQTACRAVPVTEAVGQRRSRSTASSGQRLSPFCAGQGSARDCDRLCGLVGSSPCTSPSALPQLY